MPACVKTPTHAGKSPRGERRGRAAQEQHRSGRIEGDGTDAGWAAPRSVPRSAGAEAGDSAAGRPTDRAPGRSRRPRQQRESRERVGGARVQSRARAPEQTQCAGGGDSPQKVRLGVELEVHPLEVHVELGDARVRHADGDREEVAVLAQLERGGQHRRASLEPPRARSARSGCPSARPTPFASALPARGGSGCAWGRKSRPAPVSLETGTLSLARRSFQTD